MIKRTPYQTPTAFVYGDAKELTQQLPPSGIPVGEWPPDVLLNAKPQIPQSSHPVDAPKK